MSDRPLASKRLADRVQQLEDNVDEINRRLERGEGQFVALAADIKANTEATKELVEAWKIGTGLVRFIKWLSGFVAAIAALYILFFKDTPPHT